MISLALFHIGQELDIVDENSSKTVTCTIAQRKLVTVFAMMLQSCTNLLMSHGCCIS